MVVVVVIGGSDEVNEHLFICVPTPGICNWKPVS